MTAVDIEQEIFSDLTSHLDKPWVIMILDDDKTTMEYVVAVFMKHFKLDEATAVKKMFEVHNEGSSILDSGTEEEMLAHHEAMRHYRLRSSVEKMS